MITKEELQAQGFEVSLNCDQNAINRAENDINEAYIQPILDAGEEITPAGCILRKAKLDLIFLLLCQRNTHVTRAGAKIKTTLQSNNAQAWDIIAEMGAICDFDLMKLKEEVNAPKNTPVNDICKIYFRTNFISD